MPKYTLIDVEERWDEDNEDEWLWWPRVLWIDPGGVSGVAALWFDPIALFAGQPIPRCLLAVSEMYLSGPENGVNGQVNRFLRIHRALSQEPGLATGIESFILLRLDRSEELLSPVRIRAGIEFSLSVRNPPVPLLTQSPSDAKSTVTNERLRSMGLYTEGPDHINDAKRHALLHLRKLRAAGVDYFKQIHGDEEGWWQ